MEKIKVFKDIKKNKYLRSRNLKHYLKNIRESKYLKSRDTIPLSSFLPHS